MTKLAKALLTLNDYVNEDREPRLKTLHMFGIFAATQFGQDALAKVYANLCESA